MLHQAYESTLMLIKDILGRILRPSAIREHLRGDISKIDVTQLLDASDFDVGAQCRVELERLYDDDCDIESDNCSIMKGQHKGVIKRIRDVTPKVVDLGCICHLCNLCV